MALTKKQKAGVGAGIAAFLIGLIAVMKRAPPPLPPGDVQVTDLVIEPTDVYVGDLVTISVLVTNIGTTSGTKTEVLSGIDGTQAKSITLAPGQSERVTFTCTTATPKTYWVNVDGLSGSFVAVEVAPPPPEYGAVFGYVSDKSTGARIGNAPVIIDTTLAYSDPDGYYAFAGLHPDSTYTLRCTLSPYLRSISPKYNIKVAKRYN